MSQADSSAGQITILLQQMGAGDRLAREQLVTLVLPHLRRVASQHMRGERSNHTLQPTALVNEVFLRLDGSECLLLLENRSQFFALATELMRRVLVDYARRRRTEKRGSGLAPLELKDWQAYASDQPELILEVDRLVSRLSVLDARQGRVVEMRCFVGLTENEIAEALGVSAKTVGRDWRMAQAWMRKELAGK